MRIQSMGRKTKPISRHSLHVEASQMARLHYAAALFSESNGLVDRRVDRTRPFKRQIIADQINKVLKLNVISPSHSS